MVDGWVYSWCYTQPDEVSTRREVLSSCGSLPVDDAQYEEEGHVKNKESYAFSLSLVLSVEVHFFPFIVIEGMLPVPPYNFTLLPSQKGKLLQQ